MASVYAISNINQTVSPIQTSVGLTSLLHNVEQNSPQKWTYLLANNIRFANKQAYSISLPKPEQTKLLAWVEKIVSNGHCARLFVEQLSMDEVNFKRAKQLCIENGVTLINLLRQEDIHNNVIQGPW